VANGKNKILLNPKVIGIPRGLSYFLDEFNWEEFFNIIGYSVRYSENSSVKIFELGNKYAGSDQCFPVKVYYGHVISLLEKTKNIFIPQYISFQEGTYCCPKVIGLPGLIKNSIPHEFNLITAQIDLGKHHFSMVNILRLALRLTANPIRLIKAFRYFTASIKRPRKGFNSTKLPVNNSSKGKNGLIGVVGHNYTLHDPLLNMGVLNRMMEFGFDIITSEASERFNAQENRQLYFKRRKPHWDFGQAILDAVQNMLQDDHVKGIIFITFFGCGIDAFIEEIFKNNISEKKPYLCLTLDEHSGEAGLMTRIEAFLNMIIRKEDKNRRAV
jgi:predicted nucleotide-binding protein (sugar kinase/HSP70/actin superfamily)